MKGKVKVNLKQAIDFAQAGFDIECYVLLSNANAPIEKEPEKEKRDNPRIKADTLLTLSVEGREPSQGKLGDAWPVVKKAFWGMTPRAGVSRDDILNALEAHGSSDRSAVTYMTNNLKCLRRV